VAQTSDLALGAVLAAAGAFALSWAQRALSTPARRIRRATRSVEGSLTLADGTIVTLDEQSLLAPLETALRAISWATIALASALAVARLT
jgi:ferric-dicitrate binding protein FerR (iron transport regulator)